MILRYSFLCFILLSCNSELSVTDKYEKAFEMQVSENDVYSQYLKENIELKISESKSNEAYHKIKKCDSISKLYFDYLAMVENEIKIHGNDIFFDGDIYALTGKTYVENALNYVNGMCQISTSSNFNARLKLVFGVDDIEIEENIFVKNLDYFFKGFPKIQSMAYINNKKRNVLEFENELIFVLMNEVNLDKD